MTNGPWAATRRQVALYAGGALGVSLLVVGAASQFTPAAPPRSPSAVAVAPAPPALGIPETTPSAPSQTVSVAFSEPPATRREPSDEASLMSELRQLKQTDPKGALALAREGNRRFPESSDAAERASIIVHALVELGSPSEARGEAEDMVNRYPDTEWVREIERFTGAHRHRSARVNSQGKLEFY